MSNNTEKTFAEKINAKLESWSSNLNELKGHLNVESHKALDEFENQRGKLGNWITNEAEKVKNIADLDKDKLAKFKGTLNELKNELNQEKAKTVDILKKQHVLLNNHIESLKDNLSDFYKESKEDVKAYSEKALDKLDGLNSKLDIYKLRAEHMEKEEENKWEETKSELTSKMHSLSAKIEEGKDIAEDKWDDFSNDVSEAWSNLRKTLKS